MATDADGSGGLRLKLADFGFSARFTEGQQFREVVGTGSYLAPEIHDRSYGGPEVDNWGVGVVVHLLLCRQFPAWRVEADDTGRKKARAPARPTDRPCVRRRWDVAQQRRHRRPPAPPP